MIAAGDNPFRMQRLDEVRFAPQGTDWSTLTRRLEALNYRAAIIGPHGSGKTTLMDALVPRLAARGFVVRRLHMNQEQGPTPPVAWREALTTIEADHLLLADGYDLLHAPARRHLRRATRVAGGLIVTAHHRTRLATLIHCRTSPALLARLVADLLGRPLPEATIATLYHRHHGNLRDALRELYDHAAAGRLPEPAHP